MDASQKLRMKAQGLAKLIGAVRVISPEMTTQTLETFLHIAASQPDMTARDLQERLGVVSSTATRNVAILLEHQGAGKQGLGLIQAHEDFADRRIKRLSLTTKGRKFLESIGDHLERI